MNSIVKTIAETHAQATRRYTTFMRLILCHQGEIFRLARRLCSGDDDRAQDLVQDTFVRAYRAYVRGCFQEDGNHRAWLQRIATNLYINDYHARRREAHVGLDSPAVQKQMNEAAQRAALVGTPIALLMADTLDETVERALASLPVKLRLCVTLVDLEGRPYAEAANTLGIPIGTIRSRLSRARLQLQSLLAGYARLSGT